MPYPLPVSCDLASPLKTRTSKNVKTLGLEFDIVAKLSQILRVCALTGTVPIQISILGPPRPTEVRPFVVAEKSLKAYPQGPAGPHPYAAAFYGADHLKDKWTTYELAIDEPMIRALALRGWSLDPMADAAEVLIDIKFPSQVVDRAALNINTLRRNNAPAEPPAEPTQSLVPYDVFATRIEQSVERVITELLKAGPPNAAAAMGASKPATTNALVLVTPPAPPERPQSLWWGPTLTRIEHITFTRRGLDSVSGIDFIRTPGDQLIFTPPLRQSFPPYNDSDINHVEYPMGDTMGTIELFFDANIASETRCVYAPPPRHALLAGDDPEDSRDTTYRHLALTRHSFCCFQDLVYVERITLIPTHTITRGTINFEMIHAGKRLTCPYNFTGRESGIEPGTITFGRGRLLMNIRGSFQPANPDAPVNVYLRFFGSPAIITFDFVVREPHIPRELVVLTDYRRFIEDSSNAVHTDAGMRPSFDIKWPEHTNPDALISEALYRIDFKIAPVSPRIFIGRPMPGGRKEPQLMVTPADMSRYRARLSSLAPHIQNTDACMPVTPMLGAGVIPPNTKTLEKFNIIGL